MAEVSESVLSGEGRAMPDPVRVVVADAFMRSVSSEALTDGLMYSRLRAARATGSFCRSANWKWCGVRLRHDHQGNFGAVEPQHQDHQHAEEHRHAQARH